MHEQAVQAANAALAASPLKRCEHVLKAWGAVKWKQSTYSGGQDAALNVSGKPEVNIYPSFAKLHPERQQAALVREFGKLLYRNAGDKAECIWEKKLCLPTAAQIDAVQDALKKPDPATYRELIMGFATLMDRFVALNICNALIRVSHVHRANSTNVEIRTYGSTMDYCNCRRFHPLVPFVTAYGYPELAEDPGTALAELVVWKMRHIREKSLAGSLERVVLGVFELCRQP
jgi:hypothetical protein